jgi:hypothetical protein
MKTLQPSLKFAPILKSLPHFQKIQELSSTGLAILSTRPARKEGLIIVFQRYAYKHNAPSNTSLSRWIKYFEVNIRRDETPGIIDTRKSRRL